MILRSGAMKEKAFKVCMIDPTPLNPVDGDEVVAASVDLYDCADEVMKSL